MCRNLIFPDNSYCTTLGQVAERFDLPIQSLIDGEYYLYLLKMAEEEPELHQDPGWPCLCGVDLPDESCGYTFDYDTDPFDILAVPIPGFVPPQKLEDMDT